MKNKKGEHKVRAILKDSGRVLKGPSTGHWLITPNFFNYVDEKNIAFSRMHWRLFSSFVMSPIKGVIKPNEIMYNPSLSAES